MRKFEYTPAACKGKDAKFEGSVVLRSVSFDEKFEYLQESGLELDETGQPKQGMAMVGALRKLVKMSEKHYEKVDLVRKSDKAEIKSYEDLQYTSDCHPILIEVATQLIGGGVGKI